jgi:hypothetical protein
MENLMIYCIPIIFEPGAVHLDGVAITANICSLFNDAVIYLEHIKSNDCVTMNYELGICGRKK